MAQSQYKLWIKKCKTVGASSTSIIDTVPLVSFRHLEYICDFENVTDLTSRSLKVSVIKDDSDVNYQVYAIGGDPLAIEIYLNITGGNCEFEFVNNEVVDIDVKFARLRI